MIRLPGRLGLGLAAIVLGIVLTVFVTTVYYNPVTNQDLYERQQIIQDQLTYISCILLVPLADRSPEQIAQCQVEPEAAG